MSIIAERLRELRGSSSQAEMANPLGIKYQQWAKYERGESAPGAEMLIKICKVHSCSSDWLLGLDPQTGGGVAVTGSGNAVAIGTGAKASARTVHAGRRECESCAKCPHKVLADAVRKAAGK
mgnify:CR=1 FL=1